MSWRELLAAAVLLAGASAPAAAQTPNDSARVELRELNAATAAALDSVRYVGPTLAARIVEAREARQGFVRWEQVDSIRGIGPAIMRELRARFRLPADTAAAGGAR